MLNRLTKENGAIILEASISLTAFMLFIVTILTIINVCTIQARMSYAINATAKEISQYSYLYSLTGLNDTQSKIYSKGEENTKEGKEKLNNALESLNSAYGSIESLGKKKDDVTAKIQDFDAKAITDLDLNKSSEFWSSAVDDAKNIGSSTKQAYNNIKSFVKDDPKKMMIGIAQIAGSKGFDFAKSRLIAAPLSKLMIRKHLTSQSTGDLDKECESYLAFLRVVPKGNSYLDGLNFDESTIFPNGSNEIKVNVKYDVKVIPLLPIDFSFHFDQTAVTHGWLAGDVSFKSADDYVKNKTIWTSNDDKSRDNLIRNLVIKDQLSSSDSMEKVKKMTDIHLYDSSKNEFVVVYSMNPIYNEPGKEAYDITQLTDNTLKTSIEQICANVKSTTDGETRVTTEKPDSNGNENRKQRDCTGASNRIILVVPEDAGVKERIDKIVEDANTRGVKVEVVASFGKATPEEKVEKTQNEE